jgi:hypothetical protein
MNDEYRQYLENLDKILISIRNNKEYESISSILGSNNIKGTNRDLEFQIGNKLQDDGYAKVSFTSVSVDVYITSLGIDFISKGGYIGHLKNEENKEQLDSELKTSTIKANKTNIKFFKWNLGFAILNFIILIINLINSYFNFIKPGH